MPMNATIQIFASQISHPPFSLTVCWYGFLLLFLESVESPLWDSKYIFTCVYIEWNTNSQHTYFFVALIRFTHHLSPFVAAKCSWIIYHYQWSYFAWKLSTSCQVSIDDRKTWKGFLIRSWSLNSFGKIGSRLPSGYKNTAIKKRGKCARRKVYSNMKFLLSNEKRRRNAVSSFFLYTQFVL